MAVMVRDTYTRKMKNLPRWNGQTERPEQRKTAARLSWKQRRSKGWPLLQTLDKEQFDYSEKRKTEAKRKSDQFLAERQQTPPAPQSAEATNIADEPPNKYFRMMKQLALLGYFTSEIGMTQAQRYNESPGRYDPCVDYKPGQPAWAGHA
jgi:hypothetical protein